MYPGGMAFSDTLCSGFNETKAISVHDITPVRLGSHKQPAAGRNQCFLSAVTDTDGKRRNVKLKSKIQK
jgi:hypothetical protein